MLRINKIAVIGSGNAGQYFYKHFKNKGLQVKGFARSSFPDFHNLESYDPLAESFDLSLLCTSDSAIGEVSAKLPKANGILAHISGIQKLSAIDAKHPHPAVFYPLMSLTSDAPPNIEMIPFCLEAKEEWVSESLTEFVIRLGASAHPMDTSKRAYLHLAAVLSQNFSNFLFGQAKSVLAGQQIDFSLLLPLLQQSLERLKFSDPREVQTGPAIRGDENTMNKHLELLDDEDLKGIYRLLSTNIQREYDKEL